MNKLDQTNIFYNKKIIDMLNVAILKTENKDKSFTSILVDSIPTLQRNDSSFDTYCKMKNHAIEKMIKEPQYLRILKWKGEFEDDDYVYSIGDMLFGDNVLFDSEMKDDFCDFVYSDEVYPNITEMSFKRFLPNVILYKKREPGELFWHWTLEFQNVFVYSDDCTACHLKENYVVKKGDYILKFDWDKEIYIVHSEEALNKLNYGITGSE